MAPQIADTPCTQPMIDNRVGVRKLRTRAIYCGHHRWKLSIGMASQGQSRLRLRTDNRELKGWKMDDEVKKGKHTHLC
eukprot:scaffold319_cov362-Pavlova_lutheri.AAC.3